MEGPSTKATWNPRVPSIMLRLKIMTLLITICTLLLAACARPVAPHQSAVPPSGRDILWQRYGELEPQAQPQPGSPGRQRAAAADPTPYILPPTMHESVLDMEGHPPQVRKDAGAELQGWDRTLLHSGCRPCHTPGCESVMFYFATLCHVYSSVTVLCGCHTHWRSGYMDKASPGAVVLTAILTAGDM